MNLFICFWYSGISLWCNTQELKSRSCWIIYTIILILQNKLNFRNLKYRDGKLLWPNTFLFPVNYVGTHTQTLAGPDEGSHSVTR